MNAAHKAREILASAYASEGAIADAARLRDEYADHEAYSPALRALERVISAKLSELRDIAERGLGQ